MKPNVDFIGSPTPVAICCRTVQRVGVAWSPRIYQFLKASSVSHGYCGEDKCDRHASDEAERNFVAPEQALETLNKRTENDYGGDV